MKLEDMTLKHLPKYQGRNTTRPMKYAVTLKVLREFGIAKVKMLREQIDSCSEHDPYCDDCQTAWDIMDWIKENFNLEGKDIDG